MAELKPAYLIHGDDHGAIAERRANLRALAEAEAGAGAVEILEGDTGTPAGLAMALSAMTLIPGRRVLIVDGVERWQDAEVKERLKGPMGDMPPETTVALFAREEGRAKAPKPLHEAVKRAGGQVVEQATVKPWELPRWVQERAKRMGLSMDGIAARTLVSQVGERQQRLLRELEKLALEMEPAEAEGPVRVRAEQIESRAAHSSAQRAFALADALAAGDAQAATLSYMRLRDQGERFAGMVYLIAQRLREAVAVAERLQAGESEAEVKKGLRMPPRAASRFVKDVAARDPAHLRRALQALADLELDTRGGAPITAARTERGSLREETLALLAIRDMT